MESPIIIAHNIVKIFDTGPLQVQALRGIDMEIYKGEFIAIMGHSGSGKSTFMNILGCLDIPTRGELYIEDKRVSNLNRDELALIRNRKIGFVFQSYNLLPRTTALDNVELPLLYNRAVPKGERKKACRNALEKVGLGDRMHHLSNQLSGGQQQRVAIARALVNAPIVILADEPTGNLDSRTSFEIMDLFQQLNRQGTTIVIVTHERDIANMTSRNVIFKDGRITNDIKVENPVNAGEELKKMPREESTDMIP